MLVSSARRILFRSQRSSSSRSMTSVKTDPSSRVRLVLFDVFDTLVNPRIPIHEQYYQEAIKAGIPPTSMTADSVRSGFRPGKAQALSDEDERGSFKSMDSEYPLYGKRSTPPLTPEAWWSELINRCLKAAGASDDELQEIGESASSALLNRFESDLGYSEFPETLACLKQLKDLGVKTSVVSNADPRILKTLESLGILPLLSHRPTLSWDVEASKPSSTIYQAACKACEEDVGHGVIMVGDELKADYVGGKDAGLQARLIRRKGEWSDGAARKADEDLSNVQTIDSLMSIVEEVRRRNSR